MESKVNIPEGANVEEAANAVFGHWSSSEIFNTFKNKFEALSELCAHFLKICYAGMKSGTRSIYLKNKRMKQSLLGYPEWSPFIPVNTVGLHHKFKCNAGCLYHMVRAIDVLESDEEGMRRFNAKIKETTSYKNLDHMLDKGMYMFSLHRICF